MHSKVTHPIDRLTAAESIATLLSRLDVERFPEAEALAVGRLQKQAIDEWLAANRALKEDAANESYSQPRRLK